MVTVNYGISYQHNFRTNVKRAVEFYLKLHTGDCDINDDSYGIGFILYPQALNPFLRIMETLDEVKHIMILPAFNNDSNGFSESAYLILKLPAVKYVSDFTLI